MFYQLKWLPLQIALQDCDQRGRLEQVCVIRDDLSLRTNTARLPWAKSLPRPEFKRFPIFSVIIEEQ